MTDPEPLDLSPLDPARDPERWRGLVEATRLRVEAALLQRRPEQDVLGVLGGWARPILAAAAVALVLLGAIMARGTEGESSLPAGSDAQRLAALSAGFADGHDPTGAELAAALVSRKGP